jgi:hypothetical protein
VSAVRASETGVAEVHLLFWRRWFIWPMAVEGVSLIFLWISSNVRPGNVIRCPSLTACYIADLVELNRDL